MWALGEWLVFADRGFPSSDAAVLNRVSETLPSSPRILFDRFEGDEWILIREGILQGSVDLSEWVDAAAPDGPIFPVTGQMPPFYRAR